MLLHLHWPLYQVQKKLFIFYAYYKVTMVYIGTATADTDFIAVTMSLTYPMGTTDGANDQCIDVTSVVDDLFEGDETFTVELTDLTGAISTADMTTVTITDDDG